MDIRELIGKRCLVKKDGRFSAVIIEEVKVLEVSPSGQWVRTQNVNGLRIWQPSTSLSLLETLIDLKGSREEKPCE